MTKAYHCSCCAASRFAEQYKYRPVNKKAVRHFHRTALVAGGIAKHIERSAQTPLTTRSYFFMG